MVYVLGSHARGVTIAVTILQRNPLYPRLSSLPTSRWGQGCRLPLPSLRACRQLPGSARFHCRTLLPLHCHFWCAFSGRVLQATLVRRKKKKKANSRVSSRCGGGFSLGNLIAYAPAKKKKQVPYLRFHIFGNYLYLLNAYPWEKTRQHTPSS